MASTLSLALLLQRFCDLITSPRGIRCLTFRPFRPLCSSRSLFLKSPIATSHSTPSDRPARCRAAGPGKSHGCHSKQSEACRGASGDQRDTHKSHKISAEGRARHCTMGWRCIASAAARSPLVLTREGHRHRIGSSCGCGRLLMRRYKSKFPSDHPKKESLNSLKNYLQRRRVDHFAEPPIFPTSMAVDVPQPTKRELYIVGLHQAIPFVGEWSSNEIERSHCPTVASHLQAIRVSGVLWERTIPNQLYSISLLVFKRFWFHGQCDPDPGRGEHRYLPWIHVDDINNVRSCNRQHCVGHCGGC